MTAVRKSCHREPTDAQAGFSPRRAGWIVVDATGIGAGLTSFLVKALPGRVQPVVFASKLKSELDWDFVAAVETGRYKDYVDLRQPEKR